MSGQDIIVGYGVCMCVFVYVCMCVCVCMSWMGIVVRDGVVEVCMYVYTCGGRLGGRWELRVWFLFS